MNEPTPGPLKVARTFIENKPVKFGIYTKRNATHLNGTQVALCDDEANATLFAAAPEMLKALQLVADADYAGRQGLRLSGACTPENPFGQLTVKMPDGRLVDRFDIRQVASDAVIAAITLATTGETV